MARISGMLCLAIVAGKFASTSTTDYCNLQSCTQYNKVHTMCKYTSALASRCPEWSNQGLSDDEKKIIVETHNRLRRKVASGQETRGSPGPQSAAVSMPDLSWDKELEAIAQRWANQCEIRHDECRNVDRFSVGQNLAMSSSPAYDGPVLEEIIELWYNEVQYFDKNKISKYELHNMEHETCHYVQLVWAETVLIGCGRLKYKQPSGWITNYLVCNYGPGGNLLGQKIYEIKQ